MQLELATPTRLLVSTEVDEVVAPGSEGYFGVLPGHAAFLTTLGNGETMYRTGREEHRVAVLGGFAEVSNDRVIILAECAERPEEIDRERAERARQRAVLRVPRREPVQHEAVDREVGPRVPVEPHGEVAGDGIEAGRRSALQLRAQRRQHGVAIRLLGQRDVDGQPRGGRLPVAERDGLGEHATELVLEEGSSVRRVDELVNTIERVPQVLGRLGPPDP